MKGRACTLRCCAIALTLFAALGSARAIDIEISTGPILSGMAFSDPILHSKTLAAAGVAASYWESKLLDPITVKFEIDFDMMLPPSALGYFDVDAPGVTGAFDYTDVSKALLLDVTSPSDVSAVGSLQAAPFVDMITNDTTSFGAARIRVGTPETYNSTLRLTRANQKSLGLLGATDGGPGADGKLVVGFSSVPTLDFDPLDGIDPLKLDAAAIFAHEFGHGLGFIGGVDHIDFASNPIGFPAPGHPDDFSDDTIFTPLDLYRYSADSLSKPMQPSPGGVLDWAFGSASPGLPSNPYFSIDGGATKLGIFSTGAIFGDGYQAQHWKDDDLLKSSPLGLMDPELGKAELGTVSPLDVLAMDVIGYDLVLIPEPTTLLLATLGFVMLVPVLRRRG